MIDNRLFLSALNYLFFRYESKLEESRKSGIKKALMTGVLMGTVWLVIEGGSH